LGCYGNGRRSPVADALLGLGGWLYQLRCFLISQSFFFFPSLPPFYPFEMCLGDFAVASSPGCQLRGLCPAFARGAAGREASSTRCRCPSPTCLGVVGAVWFPELNLGNTGAPGSTPTPRFSWLCLRAATPLFSPVASFELKMCFKKNKAPNLPLCGAMVSGFLQTQVCVECFWLGVLRLHWSSRVWGEAGWLGARGCNSRVVALGCLQTRVLLVRFAGIFQLAEHPWRCRLSSASFHFVICTMFWGTCGYRPPP